MKENQNIELKEIWKDEYIKWICGFANAIGGKLIIGINDKGIVTGIPNAKKLLEDIPNKVRDILGIIIDVNLKFEEDKNYLEIVVESYPYPVSYKGQYHYRSGSTKQELKGAALDKFLLNKQGKRWDSVPIPNIKIEELNNEAFNLFRFKAKKSGRLDESVINDSNEAIIENLQLKEANYLKRAGILLFHKNPDCFISGAYIKVGFFRTDSELLYQDEVLGNLFEQADKTLDLILTKYLRAYITYEGITRVEKYPFPKNALREALLNAIVHKDYSSNIPIQISVYENRIIFWNSGQLPENWTVKQLLQKHPSNPYNPLLANAFFRAGYIESWGRGIEKINDECKQVSISPPSYNYDYSGIMLEFKRKGKSTKKSSEKVLDLLKANNKLTAKEISEKLNLSQRMVEKQITKLKKENRIERIGSRKTGHWNITKDEKDSSG